MKLTITGKHLEITDAARKQIAEKLTPLDRLLNESAVSAHVVISRERQQFVCEVTLHARGDHMLHGVARHSRQISAVIAAVEKVAHQAQRLTDRWKTRRKVAPSRARVAAAAAAAVMDGTVPAPGPRVIRARAYDVKPLSVEDAMLALSAGSQSFLVFRHTISEAVAVLFRRPDGHFGLIEP
ncbi:MAG: ribosome-associated translation inhibitor RaiA [Acidobacteriota bacterium]